MALPGLWVSNVFTELLNFLGKFNRGAFVIG
jgi:hypothetical protein